MSIFAFMDKPGMIIKSSLSPIHIIANDDMEIIDFLSDMMDREPIHMLQRFVDFSMRESISLIHKSDMDDITTIIFYKAPLGINYKQNRLMLFEFSDTRWLRWLSSYFQQWLDTVSPKQNKALYGFLDALTVQLIYEWTQEDEKNTLQDFRG